MNRYWDLPERMRAELTSEQIDAMLTVELMEKGVTKVDRPQLLPVQFTKPKSERMFVIKRGYGTSQLGFRNADDAQTALDSCVWLEHEYIGGEYVYKHASGFMTIETVDVCDPGDVTRLKSDNDKAKANKESNEKATEAYEKALAAVEEATSGIWEDYRECQSKARRYRKIIDTMSEYTTICDGDEEKATIFLQKAYSADEIRAAMDWFSELVTA